MKAGTTTSVVGHLLLLGWGLFQLPGARPLEATPLDVMPVDLVEISDISQFSEGSKTAPKADTASQAKVETPAPRPESNRVGAAPTDQETPLTEKATDQAAAAEASAPPPTPAPPPPKAEPPPEPKPPEPKPPEPKPPEPKPPEPEPAPEPPPTPEPPAPTPPPEKPAEAPKPTADVGELKAEPEKPAEDPKPAPAPAVKPVSKPRPPKPVEVASAEDAPDAPKPDRKAPKTPPADKTSTRPEKKSEKEFNVNDMSALLSKVDPSGGGGRASTKEASLGSPKATGQVARMTQSELDALKARVSECWTPIAGGVDGEDMTVSLRIEFNPDGSLAGNPTIKRVPPGPRGGLMGEYAVRAVIRCAPYGDVLPPEKYEMWQVVNFNFDPQAMF